MDDSDNEKLLGNPLVWCAFVVTAGLFLYFLLPVFGEFIKTLAGLVVNILKGTEGLSGSAVAAATNPVLIEITTVSIAVFCGTIGVRSVYAIVQKAKQKPYEWALPVLAIIAGLVIDTCKEIYDSKNEFVRAIYAAAVAGIFLLGGILWEQKKLKIKYNGARIIAIFCFLLPPSLIYVKYAQECGMPLSRAYQSIPSHLAWSIVVLLIMLGAIAGISRWSREK
jgi:hypothetical protein